MLAQRAPAVAGMFYPAEAAALDDAIERYLSDCAPGTEAPKALIVPHAGYVYSGPVAASAYARLGPARARIRRVVLMGPSHFLGFRGLAVPATEAFLTPLGPVPLDREAIEGLLDLPQVALNDAAHAREHSIEVQLPFLQKVLDKFALVPLLTGEVPPEAVAEVLSRLWDGPETLIVISSDLSHYLDYESARVRDLDTAKAIRTLRPEVIGPEQACGCHGIGGLLTIARRHGLEIQELDLRNSGDTAGTRNRVVGYGAFAIWEGRPENIPFPGRHLGGPHQ